MVNGHDSGAFRYVSLVNAYPRLTRGEEQTLWSHWHETSDRSARERIIRANQRYAVMVALKYRFYRIPLDDLISEANFGLAYAFGKFDPNRGITFAGYATYWMRAYVLDYVIRTWSVVGAGRGPLRSKLFFKLRRERARIQSLLGEGEQADALLAERCGLAREQLTEALQRVDYRDVSLDTPAEGATLPMLDTLVSPTCSQERLLADAENGRQLQQIVDIALNSLDKREQLVIRMRVMTDTERSLSFAALGQRLGISRERVRQLEVRALRKLKIKLQDLIASGHPCDAPVFSAA